MSGDSWRAAGILALLLATSGCAVPAATRTAGVDLQAFTRAAENGRAANEAIRRSRRLMYAWLEEADPVSGLLPRNLDQSRDFWNPQDAAADLYPFLVLTAAFTDSALYHGRMRDILRAETALTSRVGRMPDAYSFSRRTFVDSVPQLDRVMFGASEYVKDGLLPITEWLGATPWSERMLGILDEMWSRAPVETSGGRIVSENPEVNGEMLQTLARVYWMTGEERYLDHAVRLGDYYLLGGHHPTRDFERLRLRDHGNEVVSGLAELYATVRHARPGVAARYRAPIHAMLDRILEVGRNEHGLFHNVVDPRSGQVVDARPADNFGYILNAFYTVYLLDGTEEYREATRRALGALQPHYTHQDWESGSADGDADAIEGALNLYNREPVPTAAEWIEAQTRLMWSKQDSAHRANTERWRGSGIVEGWHGDGNFNRTSLMYALWKSQGAHAHPWRDDLRLGAVREEGAILLSLEADSAWSGVLRLDAPRHRTQMRLPLDWPRINQFPEWFTVEADRRYRLTDVRDGTVTVVTGEALLQGIPVQVRPGIAARLHVKPL